MLYGRFLGVVHTAKPKFGAHSLIATPLHCLCCFSMSIGLWVLLCHQPLLFAGICPLCFTLIIPHQFLGYFFEDEILIKVKLKDICI